MTTIRYAQKGTMNRRLGCMLTYMSPFPIYLTPADILALGSSEERLTKQLLESPMKKTTKSAKSPGGPHGLGEPVCPPMAYREKYWSELTHEERTERMRREVKNLSRSMQALARELGELHDGYHRHEHKADGTIVTRPGSKTYGLCNEDRRVESNGPNPDDVYF